MRSYHYRKNEYGGWVVQDQHGEKAPRPHSFNHPENARKRSEELNRAARSFRETDAPKETT